MIIMSCDLSRTLLADQASNFSHIHLVKNELFIVLLVIRIGGKFVQVNID